MTLTLHRRLSDAEATEACGRAIAQVLRQQGLPGLLLTLRGELGAGKTTLVRALLRALGVTGRIKSPSYALVEPYEVELGLEFNKITHKHVYHVDLYRFSSPDEWLDAGLDELFDGHSLCLVEWPQKAPGLLPHVDVEISLDPVDDARDITLHARSAAGQALLQSLDTALNRG